jgi:hypothetical protein
MKDKPTEQEQEQPKHHKSTPLATPTNTCEQGKQLKKDNVCVNSQEVWFLTLSLSLSLSLSTLKGTAEGEREST